MDSWMQHLLIELAPRLRPKWLLISSTDDSDAEPGLAPKASLGMSLRVMASPSAGTRSPGADGGAAAGTDEARIESVEISAELIDSASRRTVTSVRVRPPSL